jgi:hypothetical protein
MIIYSWRPVFLYADIHCSFDRRSQSNVRVRFSPKNLAGLCNIRGTDDWISVLDVGRCSRTLSTSVVICGQLPRQILCCVRSADVGSVTKVKLHFLTHISVPCSYHHLALRLGRGPYLRTLFLSPPRSLASSRSISPYFVLITTSLFGLVEALDRLNKRSISDTITKEHSEPSFHS